MKKIPTFALGLVVGVLLTAGSAVGAASYLKATPKTVKIVVGNNQKSVEAVNVNEKLYVPVRDVGNSFGFSVSGVTSTTVMFTEEVAAKSVTNATNTGSSETTKVGGEYVQGLHDKYSTNGKLDANKVKAGIVAKEITINAQNKEDGNSLLHYVVMENNFAVYEVIKVNALNVNIQNKKLQTPLHLAVINENNFYLGELTTQYKSDATIKDDAGKQPIDYASNSSTKADLKLYML